MATSPLCPTIQNCCRFFIALAVACALPSAPLHSQEVGEGGGESNTAGGIVSPPPERLLVSPGGVDMRTGEYAYEQTDVSIGEDSEQGGLELTRSMKSDVLGHISPFGNFAHNWEIMLSEKLVSVLNGNFTHGSGTDQFIGIHFGGRSESFQAIPSAPSNYEQVSRNTRASLTCTSAAATGICTFQATDGTLAVFRPIGNQDCSSFYRCAYVAYMVLPDGTRFDFAYENPTPGVANTTRLRRVTSSRGYALLFEYDAAVWNHVAKSCVLNLAYAALPANNICPGSALSAATYTYSGTGATRRLASVTDASNAVWSFSYTAAAITPFTCPIAMEGDAFPPPPTGMLMGFVRPGETTPWLINSYSEWQNNDGLIDEVVHRQDFADGSRFEYCYVTSPQIEGQIPALAGGSYTNTLGERVTLEYGFPYYPGTASPTGGPYGISHPPYFWCCDINVQITPGPIRVTDAIGRVTTTDYCDPNAMANLPPQEHHRCIVMPVPYAVTDPEGIRAEMVWDVQARNLLQLRRKAITGTGLPDIVVSSTFDCAAPINCARPTSHTDARGNITNFTYSSTHGGLLTETGPAVDVVLPDGTVRAAVRPQTRNTYVQRQAWVSNGAGGYVQTGQSIWLLATTSMCRSSAATGNPASPCAVAGDEVLTSYDYGPESGPNNLLLRGIVMSADGVSLRTCYGYDQRGRRISETQPAANLTSCP